MPFIFSCLGVYRKGYFKLYGVTGFPEHPHEYAVCMVSIPLTFRARFRCGVCGRRPLTAGMFKLWSATLKKNGPYSLYVLTNADFAPKLKLYRNNKIFHAVFQKDLLFLSRIDGFLSETSAVCCICSCCFRFCIPLLSHHFIGYSAAAIVSAAVIIANFSYQLVGDALKTVLSVDGK